MSPALAGGFLTTAQPGKSQIGLFVCLFKFIYFWLCWVFVAAHGLSSCGKQGLLFVTVHSLLIVVAALVA